MTTKSLRVNLWEKRSLPSGVMILSKVDRPFQPAAVRVLSLQARLLFKKMSEKRITVAEGIEALSKLPGGGYMLLDSGGK